MSILRLRCAALLLLSWSAGAPLASASPLSLSLALLAARALLAAAASPLAAAAPPCHTVVVAAGAPRTGSTHQLKLLRLALSELWPDDVSFMGFWKWETHAKLAPDKAAEYLGRQAERRAAWTPRTVVVHKSHTFDPELASLCANRAVFVTHASGILAGFFPLNLDAVVGHLDVAFRDLTSWRPLAVLDQASDALRLNRTASFVRAYDALASALGSPLRADWAHPPSAFMTGALESLAQESNRDIPSARSNASFRRTVRGLVAAASGRLEDDPRFEGVRWLCDGEPP